MRLILLPRRGRGIAAFSMGDLHLAIKFLRPFGAIPRRAICPRVARRSKPCRSTRGYLPAPLRGEFKARATCPLHPCPSGAKNAPGEARGASPHQLPSRRVKKQGPHSRPLFMISFLNHSYHSRFDGRSASVHTITATRRRRTVRPAIARPSRLSVPGSGMVVVLPRICTRRPPGFGAVPALVRTN